MTDVFISFSSTDKNIANNLCAKLEQAEIKCWMAPRDIRPGEDYPAGIVRGIDNCKCMVIIFSEYSNASRHVLREVERAVGKGIVIIPFKISDIMPSDSMDYFLKVAHWLDAKDVSLDKAIEQLIQTTSAVIDQSAGVEPPRVKVTEKQLSTFAKPTWSVAVVAVLFIGLMVMAYFLFAIDSENEKQRETVSAINNEVQPHQSRLNRLIQQNKVLLDDVSRKNVESALLISEQIPNHGIALKTWIDPERSQFMEGDKIKFKVLPDHDTYLAVYVHSMDGSSYLIYPNLHASVSKIIKDSVFSVGNGQAFELEIAPPFGVDIVQFIVTNDAEEFKLLLTKHTPLKGINIATVNRGVLADAMKGIKLRGISVVAASDQEKNSSEKLWGESIILIKTREKN